MDDHRSLVPIGRSVWIGAGCSPTAARRSFGLVRSSTDHRLPLRLILLGRSRIARSYGNVQEII